MKTIVFFRSGISGGTGTFAIRLAKQMIERGYSVYYYYDVINDNGNYDYLTSIGVNMINQNERILPFSDVDLLLVITYTLEEHAKAERYFKKTDNKRIVLYTVSNAVSGAMFHNYSILNRIETFLSKKYMHSLYNNDLVWFTSPKQEERYKKHYHIDKDRLNPVYYMIPIDIIGYSEQDVRNRFYIRERIILSILRADFPLRGYIFGLIDDFNEIRKQYGRVKLRIISYGDELPKLLSYIEEHGNENIELIKGCTYLELGKYINESYVNIGHGTCVLDASSRGVPSIIAIQNTYDNTTAGYFSKANTITGTDALVNGTFEEYCIKILRSSYEQYLELSNADYQYTVDNFSIVSFADRVESFMQQKLLPYRINGLNRILFKDRIDRIIRSLYFRTRINHKRIT